MPDTTNTSVDRARLKAVFGGTFVALLLALLLMPWWPNVPRDGLDPSWQSVVEWAIPNGRRFGVDLVFTIGPLGFLYTNGYQPDLFELRLAFWAGVGIVLGAFFGRYWARAPLLVSIALTAALMMATPYFRDPWLFLVPIAAAIESIETAKRGRPWLLSLLLLLSIVAGLAKFTAFIAAVVALALADALRLARNHTLPVLSAVLITGSWGLYFALTGYWNWPAYIASNLEIASGYSGAMQATGPTTEIVRFIGIALMILLVSVLTYATGEWRRCSWTTGGVFLVNALLLFLLFKAGFVRHDEHAMIAAVGLVLLAVLGAWRTSGHGSGAVVNVIALATLALSIFHLLTTREAHWNRERVAQKSRHFLIDRPRAALDAAAALVAGNASQALLDQREYALEAVRKAHPLPRLKGTVDIYNWDQAIVLAHGLDYSPRPVFQSYSAYTPSLIRRNARSLSGPSAPAYILFAAQAIDNRLPSLADGKSWPLLWSRYDPVSLIGDHVLLKRRSVLPRPVTWGETQVSRVAWDKPIALPHAKFACMWAEVEIRNNLVGRLASTLFRSPMVEIELGLAQGPSVTRRFIPAMGLTGFLLSPYVEDLNGFIDACDVASPFARNRVERVSFHATERGKHFFDPEIVVRLRTLNVGGSREYAPDSAYARMLEWLRMGDALIQAAPDRCEHPPHWQEGKVLAHASCQIPMLWPQQGRLEIDFGIFPGAWKDGKTNGVRFEVRGLEQGVWKILASRELRPRERAEDRNGGRFSLDLPKTVESLLLVTDALGDAAWDWAYWGPIHAGATD